MYIYDTDIYLVWLSDIYTSNFYIYIYVCNKNIINSILKICCAQRSKSAIRYIYIYISVELLRSRCSTGNYIPFLYIYIYILSIYIYLYIYIYINPILHCLMDTTDIIITDNIFLLLATIFCNVIHIYIYIYTGI